MAPNQILWQWISERLPLLNISELCRRAKVARHRIADAQRDKAELTEQELKRITEIIKTLY